ncbi:FAD/NAD(P)-binding domain-containing protein [Dichomitus squalens]|uniref:FAD/NAD(P)-binding domain-containing protein n=1 Tax=Dichomitus squalens TaxID=114155 RepID=A0A4Q9NRG5_9APHY|nr:FAD/NAD(P)-binding domain-containing protein [Dichomitus squalens]TBU61770.1 FAD/NAD(P)-binding domain-containing protein [Dichomitus squalens]
MATTTYPRIAIIGRGPGGLTLALTLHRRGVPFTVYERETSADSRAHLGGMLDLGYESGQRALRENGLGEVFARNSRPEADSFRAYDPEGNLLFAKDPDPNQDPLDVRPEIDRSVLRKILVDAIPANAVKWSHALASVRDLGNGSRELTFANGNTAVVDILVGADGATTRASDTKKPELQDVVSMLGNGSMFSFGHEMMLGSQLNGNGRIRTYAWFPGPEDGKLPNEPAEARKVLLEIFKNRAPSLRKLIEYCNDGAIYQRSLYRLPLDHKWEHVPGVMILGDAAHLMSPAAGAGVNLAMLDALELGIVLADTINGARTVEEREAAVATWEKERIEAANHFAVIANTNVQAWTSTEDPASILQSMFKRMGDSAVRRKA